MGRKNAARLLKRLEEASPAIRARAIDEIREQRLRETESVVRKHLRDSSYDVRYAAAEALGVIGTSSSVDALIEALEDPGELVRLVAAESLGRLGRKKAVPALRRLLRDRSELVRGYAAEAIAELGAKNAVGDIERALVGEHRDAAKLRYHVALFRLGLRDHLPDIVALLRARSYRVRCAAVNSLVELVRYLPKEEIMQALQQRLVVEKTTAVQSAIRASIHYLGTCSADPAPESEH